MASRIAQPIFSLLVLSVMGCSGANGQSATQTSQRSFAPTATAIPATPPSQPAQTDEPATPRTPAEFAAHDSLYPFYMPMTGLRRPAVKLFVKCDASRAAGREVYKGQDAASLYGRAEGGFEFVYEALDGAGQPCA